MYFPFLIKYNLVLDMKLLILMIALIYCLNVKSKPSTTSSNSRTSMVMPKTTPIKRRTTAATNKKTTSSSSRTSTVKPKTIPDNRRTTASTNNKKTTSSSSRITTTVKPKTTPNNRRTTVSSNRKTSSSSSRTSSVKLRTIPNNRRTTASTNKKTTSNNLGTSTVKPRITPTNRRTTASTYPKTSTFKPSTTSRTSNGTYEEKTNSFLHILVSIFLVCESGWIYFNGTNSCYRFFISKKSWTAARRSCQRQNAELASITDSATNLFLISLTTWRTWIGGYRGREPRSWNWTDGNTWNYTNWSWNEPNNSGGVQDKLSFNYGAFGRWDDDSEWSQYPFICKRELERI